MSWITLTAADIRARLSGPELKALQTVALAPDQVDPLPETLVNVAAEIRGYVAACGRNTLGPDGTIPSELLSAAINRARYELATRLPVASLLTDARKEANKDAIALFRQVAACQFALVQPETPADDQPAGPAVQIATKTTRRFTRDTLNGL